MKDFILNSSDTILGNRPNPLRNLDLESQYIAARVLGWTWTMVLSMAFLSIFLSGVTWVPLLPIIGGLALTVATFSEAGKRQKAIATVPALSPAPALSRGAKSVWLLEREA